MTKKDYETIAMVLRESRRSEAWQEGRDKIDQVSRRFASELLSTNRRFDTQRFLTACDHKRTYEVAA